MKFTILFFYIHLVYSEWHSFMSAYTGISGKTTEGIQEFSAVTTLDEQQIDYYDNNTKKLIPRWYRMKEFASNEEWKEYIKIREKHRQIFRNNIHVLMEQLSQSHGVHTYQRMYGCKRNDETGESRVFDQYGYDGEDFTSLNLMKLRYISAVEQAIPTVQKWNKDTEQLKSLKHYYDHVCVHWLKTFLLWSKATLKKAGSPKVSLLQKSPNNYTCHVTGFLFRDTSISWRTNGRDMNNSCISGTGDTLPNGDGTFQRRLALSVLPGECKEDEYACVVEHKTFAEPIQKILTVNGTKSNYMKHEADSHVTYRAFAVIIPVIGLIAVIGLCVWKRCKTPTDKNKIISYDNSKDPLISEPSETSPALDPDPDSPASSHEGAAPHGSFTVSH